ncbi:uncharacterized protein LOC112270927 [Brachypodium distachyon]|uniref:Uncharacterized protein n=1 Tax=Brachypodium distachyon TaxID=15368 RepID=A0A0Q3FZC1_BRADI|nr:uncharacterized protein LOC112270927 [Brachypodium distachyon]KQK04712.1 hypothetical protein BRADI_2g15471v3 [Brachypodium distachyon]|eukprot:XP_024315374.1 uncharacterized protein LOC112270927 [Brachypodium distachyon]
MHMQVLRLLAARRAVPTIASASAADACCHESQDEGPFFDLDFRASSVRASSASSGSGSDSDESCDFVISLQRSRSSSALPFQEPKRSKLVGLRTLSFGARSKAAHFPRRRSSCSSSSARSSSSSSLTLRLFMDTPDRTEEDDDAVESPRSRRAAPSGDAIRRCLSSISRRLTRFRTVDAGRRLRKCHSAPAPASRSDDSALQTQDGIAGAIAHCKESFHRGI